MESYISLSNRGGEKQEGRCRRVGKSGQAVVTVSTGHARLTRFNYLRNESCHALRFR